MSRLLTLLLLYQHNYEVGRYISLERHIEEAKVEYYKCLKASSGGWHDSQHDLLPWWHYFLGVVRVAYDELKKRVELSSGGDTKSAIIRQAILSFGHPFAVSEICRLYPSFDRELVKKVIFAMHNENLLVMTGKGRGAKWQVT